MRKLWELAHGVLWKALLFTERRLAAYDYDHDAPCRECGCIDSDCCVDLTGEPCWWVQDDLCSACASPEELRKAQVWVAGWDGR